MKTVKAKFLNKYLLMSIVAFHDVSGSNSPENYEINGKEVFFKSPDFETCYADFIKELKEFTCETEDISVVRDYILSCLNEIVSGDGFVQEGNKIIFPKDDNASFKIRLKKDIENYTNLIRSLCKNDEKEYPVGLTDIYNNTLNSVFRPQHGKTTGALPALPAGSGEYTPAYDVRFDMDKMKAKCDELKSLLEKILFIHDRLNHFKQWQLRYDIDLGGEASGKNYKFSPQFYPKFEELCKPELQRLDERMEIGLKYNTPVPVEAETNPDHNDLPSARYTRNGSDTDLPELSTALLLTNGITRKDGKKMTRKELKEAFEVPFGMEIRDAGVKLQNAVRQKKTTAPFPENLVKAFVEYTKERRQIA